MNKKTKDLLTLLGIGGLLIQTIRTIVNEAKDQVVNDINEKIESMEETK